VSPSDEHNERGEVISDVFTDPVMRKKMMEKRMRKIDFAKKELSKLFPVKLEGPVHADVTLIGWGSTYNLLRALQRRLAKRDQCQYPDDQGDRPFLSEDVMRL